MKKIIAAAALLLTSSIAIAQGVPQRINYQAVAIDADGDPIPGYDMVGRPIDNAEMDIRLTVLDGSPSGAERFKETHTVRTDAYGLFTLEIGGGTLINGDFVTINWADSDRFLRVEMDRFRNGNWTLLGVQKMLTVPYSFIAERALKADFADQAQQAVQSTFARFSDTAFFAATSATANHSLSADTSTWAVNVINNNDNDADSTNELQTLTITNDTVLSITKGNSVTLPTSVGPQGAQGSPGKDGNSVLNGSTNPISGIGANGDFYINTSSNTLFGPKSGGVWPSGVSLVGPQGIAGSIGATGLQGPAGSSGVVGPQGPIGLTGPQGPAGSNGANGFSALINTTIEPVSSNCPYGGIKVETGLDANSNGILEQNEIILSQIKYVCNGSSFGFNSSPYLSMNVFSSPGSFVWTCPVNVTKVIIELWGGGGAGTGSGGQGGGYGKEMLSVTPGQNYFIEVGAGGCAYLCNGFSAAGKGGNSSFGTIYANGGSGVNNSTCNSNINNGISNATFNVTGGAGRASSATSGGSSFGIWSVPPGSNGQEPGGGSGQMNNNFPCGGNGRVVVYY